MSIVVESTPEASEPVQEAVVEEAVEVEATAEPEGNVIEEAPQADIPAKYAGKTLEEVIEMQQNVEQALGKQGSEVGEQRKLIQSLLEAQNKAQATIE